MVLKYSGTILNLQNIVFIIGDLPKAAKVEIKVIVILRLRFPPKTTVHILDAPPPGLIPVTNNPNWKVGSVKTTWDKAKAT
jgi:hypothetical protein